MTERISASDYRRKMGLEPVRPRSRVNVRPRHTPHEMNKTEAEYAQHLERRRIVGEIQGYLFEPWKFRLADRTYLTADFVVLAADGSLEVHEVKGHMEDDAAVKLKVAAEGFLWFRWFVVRRRTKKDGGGWSITELT